MSVHDQPPDAWPPYDDRLANEDEPARPTAPPPAASSGRATRAGGARRRGRGSDTRNGSGEWIEWPTASGLGRLNGVVLFALVAGIGLLGAWQFRASDGTARGLWLV